MYIGQIRAACLCDLRETVLVLCLWSVAQSLGHDLALAEEEPAGASPLCPDFLETVVSHVSHGEHPAVVIFVYVFSDFVYEGLL